MQIKQDSPSKNRRAYMAEWRKNNPDSIRESNRKYYEKLKAKRVELVSEYAKTLSQQFPGFILMAYRGEPLMCSVLPSGIEITVTGIATPGETATIKVTKDNQVVDVLSGITHDKLYQTVDWEKVRLAWR